MKITSGFSEQTKAILWRVFMCMDVTFRRGSGSQCSTTKHSHPSINSLSFPGKWHRGNVWRTHFIFSLTFYFTPLKRQLVSVRHLMENGKSLTGCAFNSPSQITSWAKPHCWENKPQFSFCCFLLKHVFMLPRRRCGTSLQREHKHNHSHKSVTFRVPTYEAVKQCFAAWCGISHSFQPSTQFVSHYSQVWSRDCHCTPFYCRVSPPPFDLWLPPESQTGVLREKHKHHYHDGPSPGLNFEEKRAPFFSQID